MKIKLLSVILSLVMLAGTAFAGPFSANAKTKEFRQAQNFHYSFFHR